MTITTVTRSTIQRIVIEITIVAVGIALDPIHHHVSKTLLINKIDFKISKALKKDNFW